MAPACGVWYLVGNTSAMRTKKPANKMNEVSRVPLKHPTKSTFKS